MWEKILLIVDYCWKNWHAWPGVEVLNLGIRFINPRRKISWNLTITNTFQPPQPSWGGTAQVSIPSRGRELGWGCKGIGKLGLTPSSTPRGIAHNVGHEGQSSVTYNRVTSVFIKGSHVKCVCIGKIYILLPTHVQLFSDTGYCVYIWCMQVVYTVPTYNYDHPY